MLALHLCLDSVLKTLHINKGILTAKECGKCASKERNWCELTAIDIATKRPDVVQQTLDVVREQSAVKYDPFLGELTELLKGEADITAIDT